MHLARLRLRDFRNYGRLDADFTPGFHLFLGGNAQGKTNILEAVYLLATLRSFRGAGGALMVRQGRRGYFVGATVVGHGARDVRLYWSATEHKLTLDGQPVKRLVDYYGTLRAVVFCTEDLQLVKGGASQRRRFLDLVAAQTHTPYLLVRQRYLRVLRSRNALLKAPVCDETALESFTQELISAGQPIIELRRALVPRFAPVAQLAYERISQGGEELRLEYAPNVREDFAVELARSRPREKVFRATLVGPHRDELSIEVDRKPAAQFASEGQKRTIAIALKSAQAEYISGFHGAPPVLLIDDVMGELDARRRGGLLPLLQRSHQATGQVFMSATEESWPRELGDRIQRWEVVAGTLRRGPATA